MWSVVSGRWLNNRNLVGGRLLFWSVVNFFHSHRSVVGGFSDRWSMVGGAWSVVGGRCHCGRWAVVLYYAGKLPGICTKKGIILRRKAKIAFCIQNTCRIDKGTQD